MVYIADAEQDAALLCLGAWPTIAWGRRAARPAKQHAWRGQLCDERRGVLVCVVRAHGFKFPPWRKLVVLGFYLALSLSCDQL